MKTLIRSLHILVTNVPDYTPPPPPTLSRQPTFQEIDRRKVKALDKLKER